jgi:hypothetical protein
MSSRRCGPASRPPRPGASAAVAIIGRAVFRFVAIGISALFFLVPAAASAQCGGDTHLPPTVKLGEGRAPLAVGDSVMLGAIGPIRRAGYEVDASGCRLWSQGLELLKSRARRGSLPELVVIGLGTNWTVTNDDIRAALAVVGPERVLGLVTPRELEGEPSSDQVVIRQAAERWPGRIEVIDWVAASEGKRGWFYDDGVHLRPAGARALAQLMRQAALAPEPEQAPEPSEPSREAIALLGRGTELGSAGSGSALPAVLVAVLVALIGALLLPLRR